MNSLKLIIIDIAYNKFREIPSIGKVQWRKILAAMHKICLGHI